MTLKRSAIADPQTSITEFFSAVPIYSSISKKSSSRRTSSLKSGEKKACRNMQDVPPPKKRKVLGPISSNIHTPGPSRQFKTPAPKTCSNVLSTTESPGATQPLISRPVRMPPTPTSNPRVSGQTSVSSRNSATLTRVSASRAIIIESESETEEDDDDDDDHPFNEGIADNSNTWIADNFIVLSSQTQTIGTVTPRGVHTFESFNKAISTAGTFSHNELDFEIPGTQSDFQTEKQKIGNIDQINFGTRQQPTTNLADRSTISRSVTIESQGLNFEIPGTQRPPVNGESYFQDLDSPIPDSQTLNFEILGTQVSEGGAQRPPQNCRKTHWQDWQPPDFEVPGTQRGIVGSPLLAMINIGTSMTVGCTSRMDNRPRVAATAWDVEFEVSGTRCDAEQKEQLHPSTREVIEEGVVSPPASESQFIVPGTQEQWPPSWHQEDHSHRTVQRRDSSPVGHILRSTSDEEKRHSLRSGDGSEKQLKEDEGVVKASEAESPPALDEKDISAVKGFLTMICDDRSLESGDRGSSLDIGQPVPTSSQSRSQDTQFSDDTGFWRALDAFNAGWDSDDEK